MHFLILCIVFSALPTCNSQQFKCLTGGECIPLAFVCDGEPDCTDGSDEQRACGMIMCLKWQKEYSYSVIKKYEY